MRLLHGDAGAQVSRRSILALLPAVVFQSAPAAWSAEPTAQLATPPLAELAEPEAVRRLRALCQDRKPASWTPAEIERTGIDALVEEVALLHAPWPRDALTGTWRLAYLQPGPDGGGVDRRIPFPEFDFNDSFQVFCSPRRDEAPRAPGRTVLCCAGLLRRKSQFSSTLFLPRSSTWRRPQWSTWASSSAPAWWSRYRAAWRKTTRA